MLVDLDFIGAYCTEEHFLQQKLFFAENGPEKLVNAPRFAHARLEALDHFTVTQERGSFDAFYKDSRVKLSTFVALLEGEEVAELLRLRNSSSRRSSNSNL
jgi:hypothetical protein